MCDAPLTLADISEQTGSMRAKGTIGLNCKWDRMVGFGQQNILLTHSSFLASAAVATALAPLVASCRHV